MSKERDLPHRQAALDAALRKNRLRLLLPELVADLQGAGIVVSPSDFLSIEETDELKQRFYSRYQQLDRVSRDVWLAHAFPRIIQLLQRLAGRVGSLPVALFRRKNGLLTAVMAPADATLTRFPAFVHLGEEDLALTTTDLEHGLSLELDWYDDAGEYVQGGVYELRRWGVLAECPSS